MTTNDRYDVSAEEQSRLRKINIDRGNDYKLALAEGRIRTQSRQAIRGGRRHDRRQPPQGEAEWFRGAVRVLERGAQLLAEKG